MHLPGVSADPQVNAALTVISEDVGSALDVALDRLNALRLAHAGSDLLPVNELTGRLGRLRADLDRETHYRSRATAWS